MAATKKKTSPKKKPAKNIVKNALRNLVKDFRPEEDEGATPSEWWGEEDDDDDNIDSDDVDDRSSVFDPEISPSAVEWVDGDEPDFDDEPGFDWFPKRKTIVELRLSCAQLSHLYDLMGVRLSADEDVHVSEELAKATGLELAEKELFQKVRDLCASNDLPVDDDAFDYIIVQTSSVRLGVLPTEEL